MTPICCHHCGTRCQDQAFVREEKAFCCQGCLIIYELLMENGLGHFYDLGATVGVRMQGPPGPEQFSYLDDPAVRQRLVDFSDEKTSRVTLHIPAIHCLACVWLLENLCHLHAGVGRSQVNFPRKEVSITYDNAKMSLSRLAALLASIGYEPDLKLADLEERKQDPASRRLCLRLGVAGFAFGNIMLLSIPSYLGLDSFSGPALKNLFGYLSLLLAIPVLLYSASDYWRSALLCVRQRVLTIDFPIALGVFALFVQSAAEILSGQGEGYLDTLAGLIFFLLCGKFFQQKTYDRLAFDRDYKSFFPLSVVRKTGSRETTVAISQLKVGDRLVLRNGELIPADSKLVHGPAFIDYSFVTGESEPTAKLEGDYLYAGGQQIGGAIEVETLKPVSHSYLTSLWNHEAFQKKSDNHLNTLTNRFSRRFTFIVIGIAIGAALYWSIVDPARAVKAFTSVLIVACPCALALAAPFALGTAQRVLARRNIFLKSPLVIESMAKTDAIVFDKTGTLTASGTGSAVFHGPPLSEEEECRLYSMTRHSTHPHAVRIGEAMARRHFPEPVRSFLETAGCGMEGSVAGHEIWMGSAAWLASRNVDVPPLPTAKDYSVSEPEDRADENELGWNVGPPSPRPSPGEACEFGAKLRSAGFQPAVSPISNRQDLPNSARLEPPPPQRVGNPRYSRLETCATDRESHTLNPEGGEGRGERATFSSETPLVLSSSGSVVHVAINGKHRGCYVLAHALRPQTGRLLRQLSARYELALLSGDNERERERFRALFGSGACLKFNQSPLHKLGFIRDLQRCGKSVMMVGDGLNDAGALKQSDTGVAVVENIGAFSPASDVIMEAGMVPRLSEVLQFSKAAVRIVRLSFLISSLYNVVGISIAALGMLSPTICAILMPLSSVSVVAFACGATSWSGRRRLHGPGPLEDESGLDWPGPGNADLQSAAAPLCNRQSLLSNASPGGLEVHDTAQRGGAAADGARVSSPAFGPPFPQEAASPVRLRPRQSKAGEDARAPSGSEYRRGRQRFWAILAGRNPAPHNSRQP